VLLALVASLGAGCGGDDEPDTGSRTAPGADVTTTERTESTDTGETQTEDRTQTKPEDEGGKGGGEDKPGGGGDEDARAPVTLTGRQGRITPPVVRVPPYIAIRVELRSPDGRGYGLRFGRKRIQVGREVAAASAVFAGLRPGKALVGRPIGRGNRVRIVANAEPGP
jgi:hypothetical protein